jgi:hypothetical protein
MCPLNSCVGDVISNATVLKSVTFKSWLGYEGYSLGFVTVRVDLL